MEKLLQQLLDGVMALMIGITPAALGASVNLFVERGLTWGDRFSRLVVGILVSYFATRAIGAMFVRDPFLLQSIGFTLGMIGYKATPGFIASAAAIVASLPEVLKTRFLPPKDDK